MTMDDDGRAGQRLWQARERMKGDGRMPIRLHDAETLNLYIGLVRDITQLAQLRVTETGDREAIRAEFELERQRLETEMRQVEMAILQDEKAFDALRKDNKEIVLKLIEMGETGAALELQKRFLDSFGGSTLDKLIAARPSKYIDMKTSK